MSINIPSSSLSLPLVSICKEFLSTNSNIKPTSNSNLIIVILLSICFIISSIVAGIVYYFYYYEESKTM